MQDAKKAGKAGAKEQRRAEKDERRVSKDRARRAGSVGASGQLPETAASSVVPLPTVAEDRQASPVPTGRVCPPARAPAVALWRLAFDSCNCMLGIVCTEKFGTSQSAKSTNGVR